MTATEGFDAGRKVTEESREAEKQKGRGSETKPKLASVYVNLTISWDEYRRQPHFI